MFEWAAYFLERVVPVAEEHRVQLACHLNDPPAPVLTVPYCSLAPRSSMRLSNFHGSLRFHQRQHSNLRALGTVRLNLQDPQFHVLIPAGVYVTGDDGAPTRIGAEDRAHLEHLCRYVNRPPLAAGKLQRLDPETLAFALKHPWSDGTTHVVLSPMERLEKLAALVPPPRLHLVRYHGVLAPNAADREHIVPGPIAPDVDDQACEHQPDAPTPGKRAHRMAWARLVARVFLVDATVPSHPCTSGQILLAGVHPPGIPYRSNVLAAQSD